MFAKQDSTVLHGVNPEELFALIDELKKSIDLLTIQVNENKKEIVKEDDSLLSRDETAKFFKVNISTIRNWSINGVLQPYYIGDRVYFKRDEVKNALIPSNVSINKKQ